MPLKSTEKDIQAYLSIRADITDRKNAEASLFSASKLASLGVMAGGIAHEIRNPLAIIQESAGLLKKVAEKDSPPKDVIKLCSDTISNAVIRVDNIITSLKALSRNAEADPLEKINLKEAFNKALVLCEAAFKHNEITVTTTPIPKDIFVMIKESELLQVLLNLLNNAGDALEESDKREITVDLKTDKKFATLSFSDAGPGIDFENRHKIFEPFFTTKEVSKGTGLGLSLSRAIIENHEGKLNLQENNIKSSKKIVFLLSLPYMKTLEG